MSKPIVLAQRAFHLIGRRVDISFPTVVASFKTSSAASPNVATSAGTVASSHEASRVFERNKLNIGAVGGFDCAREPASGSRGFGRQTRMTT
jgi:hypothetical protein